MKRKPVVPKPKKGSLAETNPWLRDPVMRKKALLIAAATSSAVEGIHAPYRELLKSLKKPARESKRSG